MLVLTRSRDESIMIITTDGVIEVSIQKVHQNGKVQLGIEADKKIPIQRKEIHIAIERERKQANGTVTNMPSETH